MTHFLSDAPPSAKDINEALTDFGFNHDLQDVVLMYAELINRSRYGYEGGVMDQPEEYWQDMATMHWLNLWVKHVAPMPRLEQTDVFDRLRSGGSLSSEWQHLRVNNG